MSLSVVYAQQPFPQRKTKSIFLAGPTPRDATACSWRPEALSILEQLGYDGDVYVPEAADGVWNGDYINQVEWEEEGLNQADCILFWIPREMSSMPALTTNNEFGYWTARDPAKLVAGAPDGTSHVSYQRYYSNKLMIPWSTTLLDVCKAAVLKVGAGADRSGGECQVPVHIWNTASFKSWVMAQWQAKNRIDGARVEWTFRTKTGFIFSWGLKVNVYVSAEDRNKTNEFIMTRTNIASIVAFHRPKTSSFCDLMDTEVVLIREFRSAVNNNESFVWELPGGSSPKPGTQPLDVASHEFEEETGLKLDQARFKLLCTRQMVATLSTHHSNLFVVELTADEVANIRNDEKHCVTHGVAADSEITYVCVRTAKEIFSENLVDWTTLGMISQALTAM